MFRYYKLCQVLKKIDPCEDKLSLYVISIVSKSFKYPSRVHIRRLGRIGHLHTHWVPILLRPFVSSVGLSSVSSVDSTSVISASACIDMISSRIS